jgi:hypothetical protein
MECIISSPPMNWWTIVNNPYGFGRLDASSNSIIKHIIYLKIYSGIVPKGQLKLAHQFIGGKGEIKKIIPSLRNG